MRSFYDAGQNAANAYRRAFAPQFSDYVEDVVLAADTLVRVPIPEGAGVAVFSFDGDFRVRLGVVATTFTLPATTTSNGSGSELSPAARVIPAKLGDGTTTPTHICLRAAAACKGSIAFYGN
ncbi:hypothetical protein [Bosea massiliensis]|uniref:Uncharacterized protein n=1 Tax=Bosea massiliensis TaxID=151419 RepID=A0ABW0PA49_9HYPH